MGCFTLPGEAGVQQLEGNVHRDERNSGTYYHIPLYTFGTIIFLPCVVTFTIVQHFFAGGIQAF